MDRYLTDRAKRPMIVRIGLLAPLGIFIWAFASVSLDYAREGDQYTTAIGLFLTALLIWPFAETIAEAFCREQAKAFASGIEHADKDVIPLEEACRMSPGLISERILKALVRRRLLQNLQIDFSAREVRLVRPQEAPAAKRIIIVTCPHCGGRNRIVQGQEGQCEYCDRLLTGM